MHKSKSKKSILFPSSCRTSCNERCVIFCICRHFYPENPRKTGGPLHTSKGEDESLRQQKLLSKDTLKMVKKH